MGVRMSQWANGCIEREGLARLTISILVITTAGCLAYTWGYAEGVHNTQTVILPSQAATPIVLHTAQPMKLADATAAAHHSSSNSTSIGSSTKRVHRRRSRKNPPDDVPTVPSQGSQTAADTAGQQPATHAAAAAAGG